MGRGAFGLAVAFACFVSPLCAVSCGDDSSAPPEGEPSPDATGGVDTGKIDSSHPGSDASHDTGSSADAGDAGDAADAADVSIDVQEASFNCTASFDGGSTACNTCIDQSCCGMLESCDSDTACSTALQCFDACVGSGGTFSTCYSSCAPSGPNSIYFVEYADCAQTQCGGPCGYGDGGSVSISDAGDGGAHI